MMKFLILADLHFTDPEKWRKFLSIDQSLFDCILLLGDIDIMYLESLKKHFGDKPMVGVHGNHDYPGDLTHFGIPDIHGKSGKINDLTILGVEGCVRYKGGEAPLHEQGEIMDLLDGSPKVDIVISHNSPKGIHDKSDTAHVGYYGLLRYIEEKRPAYVFHGHQHQDIRTQYLDTEIIGFYGGHLFNAVTGATELVLEVDC